PVSKPHGDWLRNERQQHPLAGSSNSKQHLGRPHTHTHSTLHTPHSTLPPHLNSSLSLSRPPALAYYPTLHWPSTTNDSHHYIHQRLRLHIKQGQHHHHRSTPELIVRYV